MCLQIRKGPSSQPALKLEMFQPLKALLETALCSEDDTNSPLLAHSFSDCPPTQPLPPATSHHESGLCGGSALTTAGCVALCGGNIRPSTLLVC